MTVENHSRDTESNVNVASSAVSPWKIIQWICCTVIGVSVVACVLMAADRSRGLTSVTVTAKNADKEPKDHGVPLIKRKEALPDYELVVHSIHGHTTKLGAKPNTSAVEGLTWKLNEPISISEITGIRLQDQDKMVADAIVEVQITDDVADTPNYRFEFETSRSFSVGMRAFFFTPIGMAIAGAFFFAVLIMIAPAFPL